MNDYFAGGSKLLIPVKQVDSYFKVTRIYSDQNGESHFSTVRIKMKDKGTKND